METPEITDPFMKRMAAARTRSSAEGEHSFAAKVLARLLKRFELDCPHRKDDPEYGFAWFRDAYAHFPVKMSARRLGLASIDPLLTHFTKSAPWTMFKEVWTEFDFEPTAVAVQAYGQGLWVLHNAWNLPEQAGVTRLVRRAKSDGEGMVFEPYDAFLESVAQVWTP